MSQNEGVGGKVRKIRRKTRVTVDYRVAFRAKLPFDIG